MKKQGRPTTKPLRVTVTLAPTQAEQLQRLANEAGVTISAFCAHVLERYALQDQQVMATDILKVLIETEMQKVKEAQQQEVRAQMHRLSHLLARTALESIASRTIGGYLLQNEMNDEKARKYYQQSWKVAVDALKQPTAGVKQALNEVIAGAGEQDVGALLALRASQEGVTQKLKTVEELQQTVSGLQRQQNEMVQALNKLGGQLQETQNSMDKAERALRQAEQEWHDKPKKRIF